MVGLSILMDATLLSVATKFTVVPSNVTVYSLPSFISENVVRVTFLASLLSTETDLTGRTTLSGVLIVTSEALIFFVAPSIVAASSFVLFCATLLRT